MTPQTGRAGNRKAWWAEPLEPYAGAHSLRSAWCLATSVVPYVALWTAMYFLLGVSRWLTLLVAVPASGFLLRSFIVFHDCSHGSFMKSKRANTWVGAVVGLLVFSPFQSWRMEHAAHHASAGDLDRRGVGDVDTWTVAEYYSKPWYARLGYRLIRSGWVMFTLGPLWSMAIEPRFFPWSDRPRIRRNHWHTNIALLVLVGGLIFLIGWRDYLWIQVPIVLLAGGTGVWLFYVQHQFEGVYWARSEEWSYVDAALKGSSHLRLPKLLQFFTGNIGLHHVHHLNPRIPNYNLQRAHDANEFLQRAPEITLWQGVRAVRLKLVDEDAGRLLTFRQARRARRATLQPQPQPAA